MIDFFATDGLEYNIFKMFKNDFQRIVQVLVLAFNDVFIR